MGIIWCIIFVTIIIGYFVLRKGTSLNLSDKQIYRILKKVPKQIEKKTQEKIKQYENWTMSFINTPRLKEGEKCYWKFIACTTKKSQSWRLKEELKEIGTLYITWERIVYIEKGNTESYYNKDIKKVDFNLDHLIGDFRIIKKTWGSKNYKVQQEDYEEIGAIIGLINHLSDNI